MAKELKKKKGMTPSKEDAALAMEVIKQIQQASDEESIKQKALDEERTKKEAIVAIEKKMAIEAQEKIKKKLRDNLAKKQKSENEHKLKVFLESGDKIKWKSINNGHKLHGYVDDKFMFEILRGMTLFSLYVKDEKLIKERKITSYMGCSTNLQKLKKKSEKLI